MSDYRISNSMYKRIQERKARLLLWLAVSLVAQIAIIFICVLSGADGIIFECVLEPILLFLIWRYLRHDIRSMTYRNRLGRILFCDVDKYIERSVSGGVIKSNGRGLTYRQRARINYTLYVSVDNKIVTVPIPDKDAYLSYKKDDEVMLISYLPYPVIISRIPQSAVCPQCGKLLHYEDGACHDCGLDDIYPNFCSTPKWEQK